MDVKTIVKKTISLGSAASGIVAGTCLLSNKKASKPQKVIGVVSLVTGGLVAGTEVVPPVVGKIKKKLEIKPATCATSANTDPATV